MARKPQTTAVANWDEEFAKQAKKSAGLTNSSEGGKFFSTRAGILSYDDAPLPGNQVLCVIAAWCLENVYYAEKFDADNRVPPTCFAFCKDPDEKDEMEPHEIVDKEDVFERQSAGCADCPHNQWGSADTGRGKACSNRRRLALIPAGSYIKQKNGGFEAELFDDASHYQTVDPGFIKVPVTSGKAFDAYVKQVAEMYNRPLHGVITRIYLEPDPKRQFVMRFELVDKVPNELVPAVMARHKELDDSIDFPYSAFVPDEEESAKPNRKLAKRPAAKKTAAKRR